MNKKEVIWREILFQNRQYGTTRFTQKELARKFDFSVSTVFNALKPLRDAHVVRVTGRFFTLEDYRKLLYLWASFRNLRKAVYQEERVAADAERLEGIMLPEAVFGLYSAFKFLYGQPPADYDHVYVYLERGYLPKLLERISEFKTPKTDRIAANLFVIQPDPWMKSYPQPIFEQVFVDIWNAPEWYAKDFLRELEGKVE